MLERFRRVAIFASLAVFGLAMLGYVWLGLGGGEGGRGTYEKLDLSSLTHSPLSTAWLACSKDVCPVAAADAAPLSIPAGLEDVRRHLVDITDRDTNMRIIEFDLALSQFDISHYQRETNLNHVYVVQLEARGERATLVHLYSYQPIGEISKPDTIARGEAFLKRIRRPF